MMPGSSQGTRTKGTVSVVEIAVNEIQRSPQYPAGLALRFARVKRYRPDKAAGEADTIDTVRAIHESQGGAPAGDVP